MDEDDQLRFGFDLLDPTKIVPEDIVPFTPLGKLTLNRNPRNYFAETEQIMVRIPSRSLTFILLTCFKFQVGHVVRGIDLTDDPLLQGRLFSYLDTQLNRHNGPNFEQLPINQPRVPVHTNARDGAGKYLWTIAVFELRLLSSRSANVYPTQRRRLFPKHAQRRLSTASQQDARPWLFHGT